MKGKTIRLLPLFVGILSVWSCSRVHQKPSTLVEGRITVNKNVDTTHDYSGIGVTIIFKKDTASNADTLFHAITNKGGYFKGIAHFTKRGIYPILVSRNGQLISSSSLILANKDTVSIRATIPDFRKSVRIKSRENSAYQTYENVQNNYQRLANYVNDGVLPQDTIPSLVKTWSKLFLSIRHQYPGTMAADQATINALNLMLGYNNPEVVQIYDSLKTQSVARKDLISTVTSAVAQEKGLNGTLKFIDSLSDKAQNPRYIMKLTKRKIELLYDSTKISKAHSELLAFREKYDREYPDAAKWSKSFQYNIDHLAPGMKMPAFKVWTSKGDTITNATFKGKPYILEIAGLANSLYQNQYENLVAINLIYKKFGLKLITIPLDQNQGTINAFYKSRGGEQWLVAAAGAYKYSHMLKRFNVQYVPTRFVVNGKGKIVKEYVGGNVNLLLGGLRIAFKNQKQKKS